MQAQMDLITEEKDQTQGQLFGDMPAALKTQVKARIEQIEGVPRPVWLTDDARTQLEAGGVVIARAHEAQLRGLKKAFDKSATVKSSDLAGRLGWPMTKVTAFDSHARWDVDCAVAFFVYLHTQTEFVPFDPFVFGVPRSSWYAQATRARLSKLFEGGHLPKAIDQMIENVVEAFTGRVMVSSNLVSKKCGLRFSRTVTSVDIQQAFAMLAEQVEQHDAMEWHRRGETVRSVAKRAKAQAKAQAKADAEDDASDNRWIRPNCGPRMAELLEAGEEAFFVSTGAPKQCPMSEDERKAFEAICAIPLQSAYQGQTEVHVDAPVADGQAWYLIDWLEGECVISLYVKADDSTSPNLVDFWIKKTGTKSKQHLPVVLRARLYDFLFEDGPYEP